jgi:hypothetical protein
LDNFQFSNDGNEFKSLNKITVDIPIDPKNRSIQNLTLNVNNKIKYIKVIGKNLGVNPDGHSFQGGSHR